MVVGFWPILSGLFGWIYFFCWSLSFYPQCLLNYRRKSTSGTTVDFPMINCLGKGSHAAALVPPSNLPPFLYPSPLLSILPS